MKKKHNLSDVLGHLHNEIRNFVKHEENCKLYFAQHGINWQSMISAMREDLTTSYSNIQDGKGTSNHVAKYEKKIGSLNDPQKVDFVDEYLSSFDTEWMVNYIAFPSFNDEVLYDEGLLKILEIEPRRISFSGTIDRKLMLQLIFASLSSKYSLVYNKEKKLFEIKMWVENEKSVNNCDKEGNKHVFLSELSLISTIRLISIHIDELISYSLVEDRNDSQLAEERLERLEEFSRVSTKLVKDITDITISNKKMLELYKISNNMFHL